jgi:hypothetical protein
MNNAPDPSGSATIEVDLADGTTGARVRGILRNGITASDLERIEELWKPARMKAAEVLEAIGRHAEHRHWNWTAKAPLLATDQYAGLMIEYGGEPQGVLLYATAPGITKAKADAGLPLLYVEFIESAPWNTRTLANRPRYKAVGTVLMHAVVAISRDRGWKGRIGLPALPQAEDFYRRIGMDRFEVDREHQGLAYFELTAESAALFSPEE